MGEISDHMYKSFLDKANGLVDKKKSLSLSSAGESILKVHEFIEKSPTRHTVTLTYFKKGSAFFPKESNHVIEAYIDKKLTQDQFEGEFHNIVTQYKKVFHSILDDHYKESKA